MKDAKHKRKESAVIRLLYKTPVGRAVLKCFVNPAFSQKAGAFLSTYFSTILISFFIKKNHIDMAPYEKKKYCSFNDFFTRKRVSDKIDVYKRQR